MRIGIYVHVARDRKPTGIGLHVVELLKALGRLDTKNEYLLYYPAGWWRNEPPGLDIILPSNFRLRPVRFPSAWVGNHPQLWWKWCLPRVLNRDCVQVFHGPNHFLPSRNRSKMIVTIHDLAYFKMVVHGQQGDEMMRNWTKKALDSADAVVALSEHTRSDVIDLGVSEGIVKVIYGGAQVVPEDEIQIHRTEEIKAALSLPDKFILFVGTLQPRKNVPFLIRSFAELRKETGLPHKLVLAGHRDSSTVEIDRLASKLGIADDVIITGYVETWHLPLLYKLADVFVLPSRYEGFITVTLEAMSYGTPVIATNSSCIREGVGDAAELVQVDDDRALVAALRSVLMDDNHRSELIERGKKRAGMFSWTYCAKQTLKLYESICTRTDDDGSSKPISTDMKLSDTTYQKQLY